ncbi:hypothetical protein [Xanthomonas phage X1]|nr:hypothetical protein [Xanthomonas phage X1]
MAILAVLLGTVIVGGTFILLADIFIIRPLEGYRKDRWYDRFFM